VTSTERGNPVHLEGRDRNAHVLAALAYYEILQELGIPVRVKHIHDFDFDRKPAPPQLAILANVAALTGEQARGLERFVRNGNSVLLTGMTGTWDEENRFWTLASKYPLEDLLGATLKEYRTLDENCQVRLQKPEIRLPSHLWVGEIRNRSAEPMGSQNGWITAVRKRTGGGEAIWIPSLVDLGAWLGDRRPLSEFLNTVIAPFTHELPFRFAEPQPGCLMRVLASGDSFITVVTNGGMQPRRVRLRRPGKLIGKVLWGEASSLSSDGAEISLGPRGTAVVVWR
jgi:beta-galactosidase